MCGVEDADVGVDMDVGVLWFEGIGDDLSWIPPHSGEGWRCRRWGYHVVASES